MRVPFSDLIAQQAEIDEALWPELQTIVRQAQFIGGPMVARFESAYAAFSGTDHCVGVGNGTDAIEISLRAVGVGPGDEVIIPANTFIATAEAVIRTGATPVVVDVDEDALLMNPEAVEDAVTPRTRAIIPVHLYGQIAPVDAIQPIADRIGAVVIEDAAQSQGATRLGRVSGSLGAIAATSFYPGKNLGAAGDAGAVTTSDPDLAVRARVIGAHGSAEKYVHSAYGFNSRLDAVQACVLWHKLGRLTDWNAGRRQAAARYGELLGDLDELVLPAVLPGNEHAWHLYVVRVADREALADELANAGVTTAIHYPTPLHRSPALEGRLRIGGDLTVTDASAGRILSLPMFPHLSEEHLQHVAASLRDALVRTSARAA